jgi:hypothetical protein
MSKQALTNASSVTVADTTASGNTVVLRDSSGNISATNVAAASINVTGNVNLGVVAKTASFTCSTDALTYIVDATSGAVTATLPAVSGNAGLRYEFVKTDASHNLTIAVPDSATINGASTLVITTQYGSTTLVTDGVVWHVVA